MKVQLVETEHIYLLVVSSFCIQIQVACGSTSAKILDFRSSTREVYFDCCKWNIRKSKPEEYKLIEERVNCWWSEGDGDGGLKSSHMLEHLHGQRQLLTCCLQPQPQCLFFFFFPANPWWSEQRSKHLLSGGSPQSWHHTVARHAACFMVWDYKERPLEK